MMTAELGKWTRRGSSLSVLQYRARHAGVEWKFLCRLHELAYALSRKSRYWGDRKLSWPQARKVLIDVLHDEFPQLAEQYHAEGAIIMVVNEEKGPYASEVKAFLKKQGYIRDREQRRTRQRQWKRNMAAKDKKQALSVPDIVVEDEEERVGVDVAADIRWVYSNLPRLFKFNRAKNIEELDEEFLKSAPSDGCVALAHYALLDRKSFFEKFVVKVIGNDQSESTGTSKEEAAEHDPSLTELDKYIKGAKKE